MPTFLRLVSKCFLLIVVLVNTGCTPALLKQSHKMDFSHTGRIKLAVTAEDPTALPDAIEEQVSKNLTEWHYPVGEKTGETFSHTLTAKVGSITHTSTPTGFSFSSGDSDPRSIDFQKSDVLPVSCELTNIDQPEQHNDLSMGFTATAKDRRAFAKEKLADHISTVCFNLLRELKWPLPTTPIANEQTTQPTWIPEVRIETRTVPAQKAVPKETSKKDASSPPALESPEAIETDAEKTEDAVKTELDEPRREMIIHNQGSPVILHFGHERR